MATASKPKLKAGAETTEYKKTKEANWTLYFSMALGLIIAYGPSLAGKLEYGSTYAVVAGAVVALAGIGQKMMIDLGYIKSRTDLRITDNVKN